MKPMLIQIAAALALAAASASASASAMVTYIDADKMTDVPRNQSERESMEQIFNEHLAKLSEKLPPGQVLKVEFLDIDLAGDVFPRVAIRDVRVMKGQADWPRMHFRYSIEQDGKVIASGERRIQDPSYQLSTGPNNQELYGYEKKMLADWFRKDILHAR